MAGLELIVDAILSEAKEKADSKMAETNKRIDEINAEYAEEIKKVKEREEIARDGALNAFAERHAAEKAAYEREMILKIERETAKELILEAKNKILNMPSDEYFAYLKEIYKNQNDEDGGELLLYKEDRENMPKDFLESLGNGITLSDEEADTKGFIVRHGRVYVNCTIDAIFREKESELYDIASGKE
ncbi:MAG: hypothetical protein IK057_03190 [Clostridia bacterium]|nr:hypothetical protein [Clostridia bacterium]